MCSCCCGARWCAPSQASAPQRLGQQLPANVDVDVDVDVLPCPLSARVGLFAGGRRSSALIHPVQPSLS